MKLQAGSVLQDKYRLISVLGEGGMGSVWEAVHLQLDAPVAVKLMHPDMVASAEARERFDREAKASASLRSPHVVQVLDFGIDEASEQPFLVMELLEGESLKQRLTRRGTLPPNEVATLVAHIARALARAHGAQVVHRDLKPDNIFLSHNHDEDVAKVLDFGIAKWASQPMAGGPTATGMVLGTPFYMSPEQIRGQREIDHRTDLWSLAVIAVQCMTGSLPFRSDNLPGLALRICEGRSAAPSALGEVPAGFDNWFERATQLDPENRFATAVEMSGALQGLCTVTTEKPAEMSRAEPSPESSAPTTRERALLGSTSIGPVSSSRPKQQSGNPIPMGRPRPMTSTMAILGILGLGGVALFTEEIRGWVKPAAAPSPLDVKLDAVVKPPPPQQPLLRTATRPPPNDSPAVEGVASSELVIAADKPSIDVPPTDALASSPKKKTRAKTTTRKKVTSNAITAKQARPKPARPKPAAPTTNISKKAQAKPAVIEKVAKKVTVEKAPSPTSASSARKSPPPPTDNTQRSAANKPVAPAKPQAGDGAGRRRRTSKKPKSSNGRNRRK